jgi:hypothetical protein
VLPVNLELEFLGVQYNERLTFLDGIPNIREDLRDARLYFGAESAFFERIQRADRLNAPSGGLLGHRVEMNGHRVARVAESRAAGLRFRAARYDRGGA